MGLNNYWEALTPIDFIGQGRTAAFGARCERWEEEKFIMANEPWLLKAPQPKMGDEEFFKEVVGHRLAKHFGIHTADVAIVVIDDEFIEGLDGTALSKQPFTSEFGVGLELVKGLSTWNSAIAFRTDWEDSAMMIYAFDLMMGNDDRGEKNPNCGVLNTKLFAYDFERILNGGQQPVYKVSAHNFTTRHIFHRHLMGKTGYWEPFLDRLSELTESFVRDCAADLPESWKTEARINRLWRHISEGKRDSLKLKEELNTCLGKPLPAPGGEQNT